MKVLAFAVALAVSSATLSADKPSRPKAEQAAEGESLPYAAVDAALRRTFKSYVGLSVGEENTVNLTFANQREFEAGAALARDVWMKSVPSREYYAVPFFYFLLALALPPDLDDARAKMRDVLALPDVVYLDLDEVCGCIKVGIAVASANAAVANFAKAQGVAANIVQTVVTPRVVRMLNLQDEYRPNMAGIQIQTHVGNCTLGLPTYSFTRGKYGFLTASHCTEGPQGDMLGTWVTQAGGRWFWGDKIGVESLDLPLFDNNGNAQCPMGRSCRLSDTAFADYDRNDMGIMGRVMRPSSVCTTAGTSCSLNVTRATDDIRMVGGISGLFTGDSVNKVGRTSGWTRGAITNTCLDVNIVDRDASGNLVDTMMTMLCQYRVSATSRGGDSGSPVFTFDSTIGGGWFSGILWGGSADPNNPNFFLFSPLPGIDQELGAFVYNQAGVTTPFWSNGLFYTSNVADMLDVKVESNVVPGNEVQFVLCAGANVVHTKEIRLVEGAAAGGNWWTIATNNVVRDSRESLYTYQLAGGMLEFRKQIGGGVHEVTRVPMDHIPGGTRLTFTWLAD